MMRWMICNSGESSSGWVANRMRRRIGNESTHWRTGTRGMTQSTRWAALCAMRRAPQEGQNPRRLQAKATSFSWRALGAAQAQKAVGEDAAFEEGIELVFDEVGQARAGLSLDFC